jgi:hypothetical protein
MITGVDTRLLFIVGLSMGANAAQVNAERPGA